MKPIVWKKKGLLETYGYAYTRSDFLCSAIAALLAIGTLCYVQRLSLLYTLLLAVTMLIMLPIVLSSYMRYKQEKLKFEEYCRYFEGMRMYFKVYGKLIAALKETRKMFDEDSRMAQDIEQAVMEIECSGDYQKAIAYMEKDYENTYLKRLHALLITGEKQGGDAVYYNMDLIDYENWKNSMQLFQQKKKGARYMFYFMALLALGISVYSVVAYQGADLQDQIMQNQQYQLFTFIELELLLVLFLSVYCSLVNKKWIRRDE